jgi:ketosteroid isomerase-like protein
MEDPAYTARKEVAKANRAFYAAFEARDIEAMRSVWADHPTVRCVHPAGEVLLGPARVLDSWRAILTHGEPLAVEMVDVDVEIVGEMGWVTGIERIRSAGALEEQASDVVATNLFVRDGEAWRMVLHHASPVQRRWSSPEV